MYVVMVFCSYGFVLDCNMCSKEIVLCANINDFLELNLPNSIVFVHPLQVF